MVEAEKDRPIITMLEHKGRNMIAENQDHGHSTNNSEETTEMAKYGATRMPVDYFYFGKYRHTDLKDAIAQARREVTAKKGVLSASKRIS